MDLRHLQSFKTIAEEGSFVQAADKLQYAQSTLTIQIQQLEDELGVALFDRQRKKIQLTRAGLALLNHANQVLNQVEQMQQDMRDIVDGESGHLRVGLIEPMASLYLTDVLHSFCERYPKMRLTIEVLGTIGTHEKVATGELELGISTPPTLSSGLAFEPLLTSQMVLLIPHNSPLQFQETVSLQDLHGERILLTNPPCAYRAAIEQAFMAQGTNPYSGIEIGSLPTIKHAVQSGLGIAILPQLATRPATPGTTVKSFNDWSMHLPIGTIKKTLPTSQGRAVEAFVMLLKSAIKNNEQPDVNNDK